MAKNPPKGPGRIGAVREREQVYNPKNKHWVKIDKETHLFIDQKADNKKFKGVAKHK
jgi:hypothetical protein